MPNWVDPLNPGLMTMPQCNRCGGRALNMIEYGQAGRAWPRYYCHDPEWGKICWTVVAQLVLDVTGSPARDTQRI